MSVNVPLGDCDSRKVCQSGCCEFDCGLLSANAAIAALNRISGWFQLPHLVVEANPIHSAVA
ncbi:hypothetical protein QUA82_33760 [Microcoleus sp. F8-D3]